MDEVYSITLRNDHAELERMVAWVDSVVARLRISADTAHALHLCLEEAVVNVVRYAFEPGTMHDVNIALWRDAKAIHAEVIDDGRAFDPLSLELPEVAEGLAVRASWRIGHQADAELRWLRRLPAGRRNEPADVVVSGCLTWTDLVCDDGQGVSETYRSSLPPLLQTSKIGGVTPPPGVASASWLPRLSCRAQQPSCVTAP